MTVAAEAPALTMSQSLDDIRAALPELDDKALLQRLRDIETLSRQTQSVMLAAVAEADARGIAAGGFRYYPAAGGRDAAVVGHRGARPSGARRCRGYPPGDHR
jgi:hypothetical protein